MLSENQKKTFYAIFALIILFSAWLVFMSGKNNQPSKQAGTDTEQIKTGNLQQDVQYNEIPGDLPKDLPIELSAPVIQNQLLYIKATDEIQSVRIYESEKPLAEISKAYSDYLNKDDWKVLGKTEQPTLVSFLGTGKTVIGTLQISISENSITNKRMVSLKKKKKNPPTIVPK
mgnify:FL=1